MTDENARGIKYHPLGKNYTLRANVDQVFHCSFVSGFRVLTVVFVVSPTKNVGQSKLKKRTHFIL